MPSLPKPSVIHGIFHRLSTVETSRGIQKLINKYVGQESKDNAFDPAKAQVQSTSNAEYLDLLKKKKLSMRRGKDFVVSKHGSPVFVGGFLAKFVPEFDFSNPAHISPGLGKIGEVWDQKTESYTNKAHHFVFSIRDDLQKRSLNHFSGLSACKAGIWLVFIRQGLAFPLLDKFNVIHKRVSMPTTASTRGRFLKGKDILDTEAEVVLTENRESNYRLTPYVAPSSKSPAPVDYWTRLRSYQPTPIRAIEARALRDENRGTGDRVCVSRHGGMVCPNAQASFGHQI